MSSKFEDATQSATALLAHSELAGTAATSAGKSLWATQVIGGYDLMFPHIHQDIPTRTEVEAFVTQCFTNHQSPAKHYANASPTMIPPCEFITSEQLAGGVMVRAIGSNIMSVGYGVG